MKINLPGVLTLLRIGLVPVFVFAFYLPFHFAAPLATGIFILAALTDYLDGLAARLLRQTSRFGAFIDPVADKILVSVALVVIVSYYSKTAPFIIVLPAAVIIARELIVSGLREWMAEIGKRASVAVNFIGKCKAVFQMVAIAIFIYCTNPLTSHWILFLAYVLLYIAAALTVWTMIVYLQVAWKDLGEALDSPQA